MKVHQNRICVNSLKDFFYAVENSPSNDADHPFYRQNKENDLTESVLWFRGQDDYRWPLRPKLYRNIAESCENNYDLKNRKDFWDQVREKENVISDEFIVRNYQELDSDQQNTENKYFRYAFMQHFGFSTRLLDWTEQATPALYFALQNFFSAEKKGKRNLVPCVWLLKPFRLQEWSMDEYNGLFRKIYKPVDKATILSSTHAEEITSNRKWKVSDKPVQDVIPVPIQVPYNNERIRAQSGVFTIFPDYGTWCQKRDIKPSKFCLEGLLDSINFLFQIIIIAPQQMSDELKQIGIKQSNFFPEIPVVSSEIEENYLLRNSIH